LVAPLARGDRASGGRRDTRRTIVVPVHSREPSVAADRLIGCRDNMLRVCRPTHRNSFGFRDIAGLVNSSQCHLPCCARNRWDAAGVLTLARIVSQKEALMSRLPIYAQATLVFGLVIIVGCLTPATARAYTYRVFLDCGARWDLCVPACDYSLPGGPALGRCYDFCSRSRGICEASRIPVPASYRSSRYSRCVSRVSGGCPSCGSTAALRGLAERRKGIGC
jgi:hypothetical protein